MKYIKHLIILLLFLNLSSNILGQENNGEQTRSNFSFGITYGYKTDGGSYSGQVGYLIKRIIDINVHFGANKYEGTGVGFGLKGFFLPKNKFKPYLGATYDYFDSHGNGFSVGSDSTRSRYTPGINNVVLFHGGILYEEQPGSLFISINYKTTFPGNHLILKDGLHNFEVEDKAQRVYSPGLGITVGIIFHWWGKEPEGRIQKQAEF